jgi:hypothetical protein
MVEPCITGRIKISKANTLQDSVLEYLAFAAKTVGPVSYAGILQLGSLFIIKK